MGMRPGPLARLVDGLLGRDTYVPPEMADTWGPDHYLTGDQRLDLPDYHAYKPKARLGQWWPGVQLDCKVPYAGILIGRPGSVPESAVQWWQQTAASNQTQNTRQLVGLAPAPTPGPITIQNWISRGLAEARQSGPMAVHYLSPFEP